MLVEAKQAFYNEETGAVQPWRDIEVEDTLGNELVNEGLAAAIAAGGGGGGASSFTVTLSYAEEVNPKYFFGGIGYDMTYGYELESVIKISDNWYSAPSDGIPTGTYEVLPIREGGAGYFQILGGTGATLTGDATIILDELYETYYVKMTGDCTVHITA